MEQVAEILPWILKEDLRKQFSIEREAKRYAKDMESRGYKVDLSQQKGITDLAHGYHTSERCGFDGKLSEKRIYLEESLSPEEFNRLSCVLKKKAELYEDHKRTKIIKIEYAPHKTIIKRYNLVAPHEYFGERLFLDVDKFRKLHLVFLGKVEHYVEDEKNYIKVEYDENANRQNIVRYRLIEPSELGYVVEVYEKKTRKQLVEELGYLPSNYRREVPKYLKRQLLREYGFLCYDCKKLLKGDGFQHVHIHHVLPINQGGKTELDNLIPLCPQCHIRRHEMEKNSLKDHQNEARLGLRDGPWGWDLYH